MHVNKSNFKTPGRIRMFCFEDSVLDCLIMSLSVFVINYFHCSESPVKGGRGGKRKAAEPAVAAAEPSPKKRATRARK